MFTQKKNCSIFTQYKVKKINVVVHKNIKTYYLKIFL